MYPSDLTDAAWEWLAWEWLAWEWLRYASFRNRQYTKRAPQRTMGFGWPSPDPRRSMTVEVIRGDTGHVGNVAVIGQGLSGEGFAPNDPPKTPPALDEVEPGGSHRNERVADTGMRFQPRADRSTGMAREVVGNQRAVTGGRGTVQRLEQVQIAGGVPRGSGLSSAPGHRGRTAPRRSRPCAARGQS
jgi:hypothetical protein